jgi:hypothetical protein
VSGLQYAHRLHSVVRSVHSASQTARHQDSTLASISLSPRLRIRKCRREGFVRFDLRCFQPFSIMHYRCQGTPRKSAMFWIGFKRTDSKDPRATRVVRVISYTTQSRYGAVSSWTSLSVMRTCSSARGRRASPSNYGRRRKSVTKNGVRHST